VFWGQWGRTPLHQGSVPVAGQTGSNILANIVYDPFTQKEQQGPYAAGDLLVHYQTPLIAGNDGRFFLSNVFSGGAQRASNAGQYLDPTIIRNVTEDMAIAREEVFGPVLSVLTFETIEKALHIANNTPYGLSAGVWSASIDTCMSVARGVRSGTVWVNTFMEGYPELPFGGYKQSGLGRELGKRAVEDYTEEKTIQFHRGQRTGWWVG